MRPNLPPLPGSLAGSCARPAPKAGDDARAALGRAYGALGACSRKQRDAVRFYDTVRKKLR